MLNFAGALCARELHAGAESLSPEPGCPGSCRGTLLMRLCARIHVWLCRPQHVC